LDWQSTTTKQQFHVFIRLEAINHHLFMTRVVFKGQYRFLNFYSTLYVNRSVFIQLPPVSVSGTSCHSCSCFYHT